MKNIKSGFYPLYFACFAAFLFLVLFQFKNLSAQIPYSIQFPIFNSLNIPVNYTYMPNPIQLSQNGTINPYSAFMPGNSLLPVNILGNFLLQTQTPIGFTYMPQTENVYQTAALSYIPQQGQYNLNQILTNSSFNTNYQNSYNNQVGQALLNILGTLGSILPLSNPLGISGISPINTGTILNAMGFPLNNTSIQIPVNTLNTNNNAIINSLSQISSMYYPFTALNQAVLGLTQALPQLYISNSSYNTSVINSNDMRVAAVPQAELVLANPEYGMYCWDPALWIQAGYQVGIWCSKIPIRAQGLDKRGRFVDDTPSFSVNPTGETGFMTIYDNLISLYRGIIKADAPADYLVTVKVDSVSTVALAKRRYSSCDSCHPTPPGHINASITWGNCHECHDLGDKLHRHAYKAGIEIDNCYKCHPSGCLTGLHGQLGLWCTPCHGTLEDAAYGKMKISGQSGKPLCADCHDQEHSEPGGALFYNSAGHGGVWCINCHDATHVEVAQPIGLNDCDFCHTVQANIPWMGPNCALCHESSYSPHYVD